MAERTIRETVREDITQILALYPKAFPNEELQPVVSALLKGKDSVLSLATFEGDVLVAHLLFTACSTNNDCKLGALLAPLGVLPSHQNQEIGNELVKAGLERLKQLGFDHLYVLGDPAYYNRFGFKTELRVQPPYPIPEEWADAWQSIALSDHELLAEGILVLPKPWLDPALWAAQ